METNQQQPDPKQQDPKKQGDNENNQQGENEQEQNGKDKFRKQESEDDHRDIPEIGEDEREIEKNTPRM